MTTGINFWNHEVWAFVVTMFYLFAAMILANTLRNNPYMRDNISKWAVLGAREAVLKLRDALCESLRAGAAT